MRPKVSIIVPIYNVENYLGRCLDSLLSQTLKSIEIICVNDGSKDQSLKILRKYALKDNRIKVVSKQNGGVSSARNIGLEVATGEFIGFVDPDDWVEPEMFEKMHDLATSETIDIVMCSYIREFQSHSKLKEFKLPNQVVYKGDEVKVNMLRRLVGPVGEEIANPELLDAWGTVWSKLYRADIIKENGISFTDLKKIGTNEDTLFNIETTYHAKSFLFLNEPYYHYWRENNSSITSGFKPNLLNQWFYLFSYIENFLREKKMKEEFFLALNNRICLNTLGLGLNTISRDNQSSVISKVNKIHTFLNDQRIQKSFQQLELSHFPMVWKVFYFCGKIRFSAGFYLLLLCIESLRKVKR